MLGIGTVKPKQSNVTTISGAQVVLVIEKIHIQATNVIALTQATKILKLLAEEQQIAQIWTLFL